MSMRGSRGASSAGSIFDECHENAQVAPEAKGTLNTMLARLEKCVSAGHGASAAEIAELKKIQDAVVADMDFLAFMKGGAGLDITHVIAFIDPVPRMYTFGDTYSLRICEAKGQMAMTYRDAKNA